MLFAIDTLGGLPAHPAVVHLPVVMVPVAFVLALLAVRGRFRSWALPSAAASAILGLIGSLLAGGTGEALQSSVERTALVRNHVNAAERVNFFLVPFVALAVVMLVVEWARRGTIPFASRLTRVTDLIVPRVTAWSARTVTSLLVVVALLGGFASWAVYDAGHTGAKSVWNGVRIAPEKHDGDYDD
jgi:uncharacterized membrane protein